MKRIKPSDTKPAWPRHEVKSVECRKRDLVVRIADWTRQRDEPSYDVEVYIGGVFDWNESKTFSIHPELGPEFCATKAEAKQKAKEYATSQIARLL